MNATRLRTIFPTRKINLHTFSFAFLFLLEVSSLLLPNLIQTNNAHFDGKNFAVFKQNNLDSESHHQSFYPNFLKNCRNYIQDMMILKISLDRIFEGQS